MRKVTGTTIYVYADWDGLSKPFLVGVLHATNVRGKIIFSFEYDADWLKNKAAFALDPSLQLLHGRQYVSAHQDNFGIFLDSSPDRWGRFLMNRREAQLAREEKRKSRTLVETDYLLGVYDHYRAGALRFKTEIDGHFLDDNTTLAAPPWASLRELEQVSLAFEKPDADKNPHYTRWLSMLLAPGGSLGGARPKASVIDEKQRLWIAKFPSQNDEHDIGAWEMLLNNLAKRVGITTAPSQIKKLNSQHHTFLSQRFDRSNHGSRIHFASAMTLLQRADGDDASQGASYLELAEFIMRQGAEPVRDLEQLWCRIVFYICVSNVDDHLRNHGFIFQDNSGWVLSPAFDMNPNPLGDGLKINISEFDNTQDLTLAQEVAPYFRIKNAVAARIIQGTVKSVRFWRSEATKLGLSKGAQERMARAFRIADGQK